MDTDKRQTIQTNTFVEGMDTDTSDAMLKSSKYRLARNVRLVTDTQENTGELHLIDGAEKFIDIEGTILASTQIRDLGICVTHQHDGWCVWTIKEDGSTFRCFGPCQDDLGENISLVTRYESDDVIKLYIADGKHYILSMNVTKDCGHEIDDICQIKKQILFAPKFEGYTKGKMESGIVQYSYKLYNKHGDSSDCSFESEQIPIINAGNSFSNSGLEQGDKSECGVKISIDITKDQKDRYGKCIIYRIHTYQVGQPPIIGIVYDSQITSTSIKFIDQGKQPLQIITAEEYFGQNGLSIIPKHIESKNDYLFAANVEYVMAFQNEEDRKEIAKWDARAYRLNLHREAKLKNVNDDHYTTYQFPELIDLPFDHDCYTEQNDLDTTDYNQYIYNLDQEFGGSGPNVSWEFIHKETEVDSTDMKWYDNKLTDVLPKSLFRDELYRYGIVLYDEYGKAAPVKWIADIRTPSIVADSPYTAKDNSFYANSLGIKFTVSNLPKACSSYEIVRCKRTQSDCSILSQGVLSRPIQAVKDGKAVEGAPYTPTGFLTTGGVYVYAHTNSSSTGSVSSNFHNKHLMQFVSAETTFVPDSFYTQIKDLNLKLQLIRYISPLRSDSEYLYNLKVQSTIFQTSENFAIGYDKLDEMFYGRDSSTGHHIFNDVDYGNSYGKLQQDVYQYGKLYQSEGLVNNGQLTYSVKYKVNDVKRAQDLTWSNLFDDSKTSFAYLSNTTVIGKDQYTNWVAGIFRDESLNQYAQKYANGTLDQYLYNSVTPIGPGGRCFLIDVTQLDNLETEFLGMSKYSVDESTHAYVPVLGTYLCNLRQDVIPYGGFSYTDRELNTYESNGFITNESSIEVYDGDCFLKPLEYISMHKTYNSTSNLERSTTCIAYSIPLESRVNQQFTYGIDFSKELKKDLTYSNVQINPANVDGKFIQNIPLYLYNTAYGSDNSIRTHEANTENYLNNESDIFDYRIVNSLIKSNNEYEDSWLKFQSANYLDVDTRYGQITQLKTFKNQLVYWQDNAVGVASVNERSIIKDDSNLPLILGTGDVLDRYDYITTSNGMKNGQQTDCQSSTTLYWWDDDRTEICCYTAGSIPVILSKQKSIQNLVNNKRKEDTINDNPKTAYDCKSNEVLFNLFNTNDVKHGSVVYNENIQQFVSLYDIDFDNTIVFGDRLYLSNRSGDTLYKWNSSESGGSFGLNYNRLLPYVKYTINDNSQIVKTFDNAVVGGTFNKDSLTFKFSTPLNQNAQLNGESITDREYDYRFAIPRNNDSEYGDRLKGKTMQCELTSSSNSDDFSLQYINTKYRISWS